MSMPDRLNPNSSAESKPLFKALGLAWELGYAIAIPLVVLALAGRLLDKTWGTSPWFLLLGVLLSIFISTWLIYRKAVAILNSQAQAGPSQTQGADRQDSPKL